MILITLPKIDGDRFSKIKSIFVTDATAFVKSKLIKYNGIKNVCCSCYTMMLTNACLTKKKR